MKGLCYTHGFAVYVKEGIPFTRDLSLENPQVSYLCFRQALLHSMSYFFPLLITLLVFVHGFWCYLN